MMKQSTRRRFLGGAIAAPALLHSPISFGQSPQWLQADTNFYCDPVSGSDSNNGITAPWRHLQYAIDTLQRGYDFGARNVTINAAAGTYAEYLEVFGAFRGQRDTRSVTIRGSGSSNCLLAAPSGYHGLNVLYGAHIYVEGFAVQSNVGGFSTARSSDLEFSAIRFGACGAYHCHCGPHSSLRALGSYQIGGSAGRHADVARGQFQINAKEADGTTPTVVTVDGALLIPITLNAIEAALVNINCVFAFTPGSSVTNGVGGMRYNCGSESHINVGGAGPNYLPGDQPGVKDTTSIYG